MPEYDNIRDALVWSLGDGSDSTFAARIAASLGDLWYEAGLRADGRRFLEAVLASFDGASNPGIAGALAHAPFDDRLRQTRPWNLRRPRLTRSSGPANRCGQTARLSTSAIPFGKQARSKNSRAAIGRAIEWYESNNKTNEQDYAEALSMRAVLGFSGSDEQARDDFERAIRLYTADGFELGGARARANLAELEFARGDCAPGAAAGGTGGLGVRPIRRLVARSHLEHQSRCVSTRAGTNRRCRPQCSPRPKLSQKAGDEFLCVAAICHLTAVLALRSDESSARTLLDYINAWFTSKNIEPEWSLERSLARARASLAKTASETASEPGPPMPLSGDDAIELAMAAASRPALHMASQ